MKQSILFSIIIIAIIVTACNRPFNFDKRSKKGSDSASKSGYYTSIEHDINPDTLYTLLGRAINLDSFEFDNGYGRFIYIKTGNFLSTGDKNAVLISNPTGKAYRIELYTLSGNQWIKNDQVDGLANLGYRLPEYRDYNFDGQKDIYFEQTRSNGFSMGYGHLITIDPQTKKLEAHPEALNMANMNPDFKTKMVISDRIIECNTIMRDICHLSNKWINGKLKTVKTDCPCKGKIL